MDKRQQTINVIIACNEFRNGKIDDANLVQKICAYYDVIKEEELSQSDLQFLKKISNIAGIPHYFDHLNNFQQSLELKKHSLGTLSAEIYESTLYTGKNSKVHKYQKQILSKFNPDQQNRFFLSASTSFGKTHLVYEVIQKMKYKNIVLLFPTIALLTENLEKIYNNPAYKAYNKHTLSDVSEEDLVGSNIFVYTPERFLAFLEKKQIPPKFNFIFIDEVYKIDNEYIIAEDEKIENERDVSYRLAAYYAVLGSADVLLAGPYIEKYSRSFEHFLDDNRITKLDFNKYEIVGKTYTNIRNAKTISVDGKLKFIFSNEETAKKQRFNKIVRILCFKEKENCIAYCAAPHFAENYAKGITSLINYDKTPQEYKDFVAHIEKRYRKDWAVAKCLRNGVGIHHGLVPKYIQKEIIAFFNSGVIKTLTSTTTITEGVNTSAKNLIILQNKKGRKDLKRFDAKNILLEQQKRGIPDYIMNMFKVVNQSDKIALYDNIKSFSKEDHACIKALISKINNPSELRIDWKGFEIIQKSIFPILKDTDLKKFIAQEISTKNGIFSLLTIITDNYLKGGFTALVNYKREKQHKSTDNATREAARFVYNTAKYQMVKYLGVFNIMYKYYRSIDENKKFEDVTGIDKLITKLEYNALTDIGRKVSDYGVPDRVLRYYEESRNLEIEKSFDDFEKRILQNVENIVNKE